MDRRQIIREYFQPHYLSNEKLSALFIEPLVEEFGLLSDYAEMLQYFGSVENIPQEFLKGLGNSLAYEYLEEEDPDIQRELIKRILSIYKNRSTRWALEQTLMYSTDENWIGDNLTLYKGPLKKGYFSISKPRDEIFIHDRSRFDSGHRYMDKTNYNYGILALEVQYWTDRTAEMLERQIPGGIRYHVDQLLWFYNGEDWALPSYRTDWVQTDYSEDTIIYTDSRLVRSNIAYFDDVWERGIYPREGRIGTAVSLEEEMIFGSSFLNTLMLECGRNDITRIIEIEKYLEKSAKEGIRLFDNQVHDNAQSRDGFIYLEKENQIIHEYERLNRIETRLGRNDRFITQGVVGFNNINNVINNSCSDFDMEVEFKGIRYWDGAVNDDGTSRDGIIEPEIHGYAKDILIKPYDVIYPAAKVLSYNDKTDEIWHRFGFDVEKADEDLEEVELSIGTECGTELTLTEFEESLSDYSGNDSDDETVFEILNYVKGYRTEGSLHDNAQSRDGLDEEEL